MIGLNVLVIGGGIGGLSCAIALRQAGHDVHLVELNAGWQTYPTGITLQAHAYRAFDRIGVAHDVAAHGYTGLGSRVCRADGTVLNEILGQPLEPGLPVAGGIMRPALQDILQRRAQALGMRVSLGLTFSRIEKQGDEVEVEFTDASVARYDLVIGADGVFSKVRSLIFPDAREPHFTGQGSFRKVASRPPEIDMMTMYLGHQAKAGVTPASEELMFLWTLTPEPNDDIMPPDWQVARLREVFDGFGGVIGAIRDTLAPDTALIYRPLKALMLPKPWHSGRVLLIGDAAHATTPHLSSGASAAVEDAWVIAEHLSQSASMEEALRSFTERRFERCRFVVETSLEIGRLELAGAPSSQQEQLYAEGLDVLKSPV